MTFEDRRDDWRHGVDENLATLNAGQRLWEREFTQLRKILKDVDRLMRGDPQMDTDGVIARLHKLENDINLIQAVVLKDRAGNKGLVGRVEALESGEHRSDNRWKFFTAVTVAIISLLGLLMTNWDRIETYLKRPTKDPLERLFEKAKHPKNRVHHYKVRKPTLPDDGDSEMNSLEDP